MRRAALLAGLLALPLAADESRELFVQAGADIAALEKAHKLAALKAAEPGITWVVVEVPEKADSPAAARAQARAIAAGVTALPALALLNEKGIYATLPLPGLTVQQLEEARAHADDAARQEAAARRFFEARCYQLCARISAPDMGDDALAAAIEECRLLLQSPAANDDDRQFLGLRCLYPMLMLQYTRAYDGAHSPYTEAKLLEAIAALETARDINRDTKLGKAAFAERERLRTARRKSREYE